MTAPVRHSVDLDPYARSQQASLILSSGLTVDSQAPTNASSGASGKWSTLNSASRVCTWPTIRSFVQAGQMILITGSLFMVGGVKNFGLEDSTSFGIGLGGLVVGGIIVPSLVSLKDKVEKVREANMEARRSLW